MIHSLLRTQKDLQRRRVKVFALLLLIFSGAWLHAQQIPVYSSYFFNKYLINPAFTGIDNEFRAFGFYREQWTGISGRPTTGGATAEASFWKDRIGIGGYVINDRIGIFNTVTATVSYAQKIRIAKYHQISAGIQAGVFTNRINFADATVADLNDPGIAQMNPVKTVFDMNAGLGYKWKELLVGGGILNILQPLANYATPGLASNFEYVRHYTAFGQYKFKLLGGKFNITPQLFMRKGPATGYQFDATVMLDYKNIVFLGGGYRNPFGAIGIVGVNPFDMLTLALAYDYTTNPALEGYVGSTFEVTAGFHLPSNYKRRKGSESSSGGVDQDAYNRLQRQADSLEAATAAANKALDSTNGQMKTLQDANDSLRKQNERYQKMLDSMSRKVDELLSLKSLSGEKNLTENSYRLDKIYFDKKKYELLPESKEQLDKLAGFMQRFPKVQILVAGYTDASGNAQFNQQLSEQRAKAVADYLIAQGVKANRVEFKGLGSSNPVADSDTEEGRRLNRRVEFTITKE